MRIFDLVEVKSSMGLLPENMDNILDEYKSGLKTVYSQSHHPVQDKINNLIDKEIKALSTYTSISRNEDDDIIEYEITSRGAAYLVKRGRQYLAIEVDFDSEYTDTYSLDNMPDAKSIFNRIKQDLIIYEAVLERETDRIKYDKPRNRVKLTSRRMKG